MKLALFLSFLLVFALFSCSAFATAPTLNSLSAGNTSSSTSHALTHPGTLTTGGTEVCVIVANTSGFTWPSSGDNVWVEMMDDASAGTHSSMAWHKITGGEGATFTVTTADTSVAGYRCWAFSLTPDPTSTPPETASLMTDGTSTTPDPPSLTPSGFGGCNDTHWLVWAQVGGGTSPFSGFPSGYSNTGQQDPGNPAIGFGDRQNSASSENPGTFTLSGSDDWGANTAAVSGICAGSSVAVQRRRHTL